MITVHQYPKRFHFGIVLGQDVTTKKKKKPFKKEGKKSELVKEPTSPSGNMKSTNDQEAMDVDELTSSINKLMIPRSVTFGRNHRRQVMDKTTVKEMYNKQDPSSK